MPFFGKSTALMSLVTAIALCLSDRTSSAAAPEPPDGALSANASIDQTLDSLDQTGKNLKEFDAKVKLTEGDPNLSDYATRTGSIWYQKNDSGGRIHVLFDKRVTGRIAENNRIEYLLDGEWLTDRDYDRKIEVKRQILKPGEKMNLLKLGEGPFPLPIGQDKQEVHKEFDVTLVKPDKDDPVDTVHVLLTPRPETRLARRFSTIDVWVDRKIKFPVRIDTVDPNGTMEHKTDLSGVHLNPTSGLKDAQFKLPEIEDKSWDLHTEKFKG